VYSCSGGSDTGELSDRVARKLKSEEVVRLACLAGIGAGISGFIASAKGADMNIAIDGCPVACSRKTLEKLGANTRSFIVTELGFVKGQTPVTDETVESAAAKIRERLNAEISSRT
jgi:uncharacterized metal-binding protein